MADRDRGKIQPAEYLTVENLTVLPEDFAFARMIDLSLLRAEPESFDDPLVARRFAVRYLDPVRQAEFLTECSNRQCNAPFDGWAGQNELSREDSYLRFVEEVRPELIAAAPDLPLRIARVIRTEIGAYDRTRGQFPLDLRLSLSEPVEFGSTVLGHGRRIVHPIPKALTMSRAEASALLDRYGDAERTAWMHLEIDLGLEPAASLREYPLFTVTITAARLSQDREGAELPHEFGPFGPFGAETPTTEEVAGPVAVDVRALALHLDPGFATEQDYLAMTTAQIAFEQAGDRAGSGRGGPRLFDPAEIEGRAPGFAAAELWPAFRDRLQARLADLPQALTFRTETSLSNLAYVGGYVRAKDGQGGPDGPILDFGTVRETEKTRLPALGAREVMHTLPTLWATDAVPAPEAVHQWQVAGGLNNVRMAVDRVPGIPPLAMNAADAEKLWLAAAQNRHGAALRAEFTVEPEALRREGDSVFILTRVTGARLFGPDGAVLKEYAAADLAPATDSWAAADAAAAAREAERKAEEERQRLEQEAHDRQRALEAEQNTQQALQAGLQARLEAEAAARAQQKAEEAARVETERLAAVAAARAGAELAARLDPLRKRLEAADVAGVRLGMPLAEAEAVIRREIEVGWVGEIDPQNQMGMAPPAPSRPFSEFSAFIDAGGSQIISLFAHPAASGEVLAVARTILIPQAGLGPALRAQLEEKYGPPLPGHVRSGEPVWTADPGAVAGEPTREWFASGPCSAQTYPAFMAMGLKFTEGEALDPEQILTRIKAHAPDIRVNGGQSRDGAATFEPAAWAACGPTVLAKIEDAAGGTRLTYALLDLARYAGVYARHAAEVPAVAVPKL